MAVQGVVAPTNLAKLEPVIRERVQGILDGLPIGETVDWVDRVDGVLGIVKEYTTQMDNGPLTTELDGQEADRLRVLTETAGAAAHEINQPLQTITGLCQLMLMDMVSDAPRREKVEQIHESAKRIAGIVQEMQNIRQYATQHYVGDRNIIDFKKATQTSPPTAPDHKHRNDE